MIENKYSDLYFRIIDRAINREQLELYEKHHIIPKSLGGSNDDSNIVKLSFREHYLCHKLLTKMTIGIEKYKMLYALHIMVFSGKYGNSSRLYEKFRTTFIQNLKEHHYAKRDSTYSERMRERALEDWEKSPERRSTHSKNMKELWSSGKITPEMSRKNGQHGLFGKEHPNVKEIEYNGEIYYGWDELKKKTTITKHLYNRYYTNGFDPMPRVGSNGPISTKLKKEASDNENSNHQ